MPNIHLNFADGLIIAGYFTLLILIGLLLRRRMVTSSEYFQAGRSLPAIITGLAFVAANSGALEVMGVVSTSAKYGARANQFYWVGAIPAMLFLGLFMMPLYYRSRARSVPEFLKLRYNEATRALNAISFAIMMILVSGISLYAMAIIMKSFLGWNFGISILSAAAIVLVYVALGGLTATIYNEVLQFALIVAGLSPLAYYTLKNFHGLSGLTAALPPGLDHTWRGLAFFDPAHSSMDLVGIVFGLGFVLSFGYWCTDFLLVQRALAAKDVNAACETPLIAAVAKLFFPLLVVLPGLAAVALFPAGLAQRYDLALPLLMARYYGHGLLGLGVVAMFSSFMSGMAGNVTAFNTVWTYDIYQSYFGRDKSDAHYLFVGRIATLAATVLSIGTAYIVLQFNSLMDYVQLLFSFFNAPVFATFLLGMFTRWATPSGGFWGLLAGIGAAVAHRVAYSAQLLHYGSDMTANFYGAIAAWVVCFAVTCLVSMITARRAPEELAGLVYSRNANKSRNQGHVGAWTLAGVVAAACIVLNWWFR